MESMFSFLLNAWRKEVREVGGDAEVHRKLRQDPRQHWAVTSLTLVRIPL